MGQYSIKDFLEVKASFGPAFNPDASKIVYLNNDTGTSELYLMSRSGGDRVQLTDFPDPISAFIYSPIEEKIIFSKSEGGDENAQLYLLDVETKGIIPLAAKKAVRHNLGTFSRDGEYISYASNERNGKDFDVYVMDVRTLQSKCVWSPGGMCGAGNFSPTGKYLAMVKIHSGSNNDLYLYDRDGDVVIHISPHEGNAAYGMPRWLPDEASFLFVTDEGGEFGNLARYSMARKKFEYVLSQAWDVIGLGISREGSYLAIFVNEEGYGRITLCEPLSLVALPYEFHSGDVHSITFSRDEKYAACVFGGSESTADIWVLDMKTRELKRLTKSFQGVPPEVLVEPELIRFKSFDGLSVPAFVYKPRNIDPNKRLPVIMNIHGGPASQYRPSLSLITQYFVNAGYIVVAPNVRGSSGYGKTYMKLDDVERRMDSVRDIVALRDHLVTWPEVDSGKIVVMGGSYGGFMVLACLAFYPDLWAAGVDIVGIANFVTFLENTASYRRHLREVEYGSLEKDRKFLESISPINSVQNINAPLFIIHGANDPRVPLAEAEQMFNQLKALGRKVELLIYPDEGHGLSKLKNRLDAYPKMVDFLKEVLRAEGQNMK